MPTDEQRLTALGMADAIEDVIKGLGGLHLGVTTKAKSIVVDEVKDASQFGYMLYEGAWWFGCQEEIFSRCEGLRSTSAAVAFWPGGRDLARALDKLADALERVLEVCGGARSADVN